MRNGTIIGMYKIEKSSKKISYGRRMSGDEKKLKRKEIMRTQTRKKLK